MIKSLILSLAAILLVSCKAHDEQYYRANPKALQAALKNCPANPPSSVSCEQLQAIGAEMNRLAYSLQVNPQAFGIKILALQTEIAKQQSLQSSTANNQTLSNLEQQLNQHLAIVRWLESPES